MKTLKSRFAVLAMLAGMAMLSQCTDEGFVPGIDFDDAGSMSIVAGNNQYSFHGTELPEPLVVEVTSSDGTAARGISIRFTVTQGGGSLSETGGVTDEKGRASTRLTLGASNGPNQVRASVEANAAIAAVFDATAADFFCPEAEDSLKICGSCPEEYGVKDDLFLVTARSDLYDRAGIVQASVSSQAAFAFAEIPDQLIFNSVIWDGAFSARGDYYVSRLALFPEIIKIDIDGNVSVVARPDSIIAVDYAIELATNPAGLLVGCDHKGPFVVACRDSIIRFAEATYSGGINNDALTVDPRRHAADPLGEDIYFINTNDMTLYRLPMENRFVEPQGLQMVAQLSAEQATGARGMACNEQDGTVYILVDTPATKVLLEVTTGGAVSTLFDFFSRGGGTEQEAGVQRDLALRRPFLFTLDTLNDQLLVYDIDGDAFTPLFSDSLEQAKLSSPDPNGGERVGLAVLK